MASAVKRGVQNSTARAVLAGPTGEGGRATCLRGHHETVPDAPKASGAASSRCSTLERTIEAHRSDGRSRTLQLASRPVGSAAARRGDLIDGELASCRTGGATACHTLAAHCVSRGDGRYRAVALTQAVKRNEHATRFRPTTREGLLPKRSGWWRVGLRRPPGHFQMRDGNTGSTTSTSIY